MNLNEFFSGKTLSKEDFENLGLSEIWQAWEAESKETAVFGIDENISFEKLDDDFEVTEDI